MDRELVARLRNSAKNYAMLGGETMSSLLSEAANEIERLDKAAYLTIPIPSFLQRKPKSGKL